eukprot:1226408-Amorphochlora_amoeboformis.AAC.2
MVSDRSFALIASVIANVALVIALTSVYSTQLCLQQQGLGAPVASMRTVSAMPRFAMRCLLNHVKYQALF